MVGTSSGTVQCKVCGSFHTVRDGRVKGIQKWECRDCGRKFMENDAPYEMKTPYIQVNQAIRLYFQGSSLSTIRRLLQQNHNSSPSISTIYEWVVKYSRMAWKGTDDYHPEVGDEWVIDETTLNVAGAHVWIWDVVDIKTRFLLVSQVVVKRDKHGFNLLIKQAANKALKMPAKVIVTDSLVENFERMEYPFTVEYSTGELKNIHCPLQWRTSLMGDLKRVDKVVAFNKGWLVHYNYYTPQASLAGKTPAEITHYVFPVSEYLPL